MSPSPDLSEHQQHTARSEDPTEVFLPRFIAASESTLSAESVEALNTALDHLEAIGNWAHTHWNDFPRSKKDTTVYVTDQEFDEIAQRITAVHDAMWEAHGMHLSTNATAHPVDTPPQRNATELRTLATPEELAMTARTIRMVCHTLRNDMSTIGAIFVSRKYHSPIFSRITHSLSLFADTLREEYPKNDIHIAKAVDTVETWLYESLKGTGISVHTQPGLETLNRKQGTILWNEPWIETLTADIAQNATRSHAHEIHVSAQRRKDTQSKQVFWDIFFDNDGDDPDSQLVEQGFQDGISRHTASPGTGSAMAYHAMILRDHYGGDLQLAYRTVGDIRVPGTRVMVSIPLATP